MAGSEAPALRKPPGTATPIRLPLPRQPPTLPFSATDPYLVVDEGVPVGIVSLSRLRFLRKDTWSNTPLNEVLRGNIPQAWPDEPVDDVLQRMADHSLTVIPIMERESGKFLGTVTSDEVLDLVLLMDEVQDEVRRRDGERD